MDDLVARFITEVPFIAFLLYVWNEERKERVAMGNRYVEHLESEVESVQVQGEEKA